MNQDPPPIPDHSETNGENRPGAAPGTDQTSSGTRPGGVNFDGFTKAVEDAVKNGRNDAKKLFEEALPKAKEDLSKGVHDLAYALAYATVFTGTMIREVAPESLVEGLREGTSAGRRAAEESVRQRRERQEREATNPTGDAGNEVGSVPV